jgi:hypothetical protein
MLASLTNILPTNPPELLKVDTHLIIEITECMSAGKMSRTLIKKSDSDVSVSTLNFPDSESEIAVPYLTFVQVVSGSANLLLNGFPRELNEGDSLVIPAFVKHQFTCQNGFKMISTVLKSGY